MQGVVLPLLQPPLLLKPPLLHSRCNPLRMLINSLALPLT